MTTGAFQSDLTGVQDAGSIFLSQIDLPTEYDLSEQTRMVIDQGSVSMCVSVCLTDMMMCPIHNPKKIQIKTDYFFRKRADKKLDGMTPREALDIARADYPDIITSFAKVPNQIIIKKSIFINGPCMICLPCNSFDTNFWLGGKKYGGHAVLLTGWNDNGFVLKNSWGTSYGNKGYAVFPYEDCRYIYEAWTIF